MKRITKRSELIDLANKLGVRPEWHEPDEQSVTATVKGRRFDNAGFWPDASHPSILERHVILKQNGKPVGAVNLATLFAWATGFDD